MKIGMKLLSALFVLTSHSSLGSSEMRCGNSSTGYSVWCHTFPWGTEYCSVFDASGGLVRAYVDGNEQCRIWRAEAEEVAAW